MPVIFVVDASLPAEINTITLSYTFFEVPGRRGQGLMESVRARRGRHPRRSTP